MNNNFNLQTSHPLIQSEQTFVLDRKLISIHSVDRDYQKWPNSNHFGIDLGEAFHNVQSMRLINFAVPSNNYTFSTAYQNTMMSFSYSNNYDIDLTGWGTAANSWTMFYNIINAIFVPNGLLGADGTIPPGITVQYLTDGTIGPAPAGTWVDLPNDTVWPASSIAIIPPWQNSGWHGYGRIRWTPAEMTITIPEGSYSPLNLTETIQTLMNNAVYNASSTLGYDFLPGPGPPPMSPAGTDPSSVVVDARTTSGTTDSAWNPTGEFTGISPFVVNYNSVTNRIMFGVTQGNFSLNFAKQEIYNPSCDVNKAIFHQYTKWGLPAYLGFDKKVYTGTSTDISGAVNAYQNSAGGLYLPYDGVSNPWLQPDGRKLFFTGNGSGLLPPGFGGGTGQWTNVTSNITGLKQVAWADAEFNLDINGEDALYMEIDRYNSIDEIYPYSERTGHLYNNDLGHRVNGSFAKIPLTHVPFGQEMGSRNNFVLNVFHSDPPIQRIDRLKFTFRYHDGRLVDFKNLPFSFTLEFNMLKDEQERGKTVRVPPLYNL